MRPEDELDLAPARRTLPDRHVLCLSGGGYRGLYTALVLENLETQSGKPLREVFDVIAGTSIGGIIAAGVALGIPTSHIRSAIQTHGPDVFDQRFGWGRWRLPVQNRLRALYAARYPQKRLCKVIDTVFGTKANCLLSDICKPLVVCTVSVNQSSPHVLLSGGLTRKDASHLTVRDALLGTTAAPTYFPPHPIDDDILVDGGLVANAPDLVAVTESVRRLPCNLENVRVLSIGTAGGAHAVPTSIVAPGLLDWVIRKGLVQLTLSAQEQLAVKQCYVLLRDRYVRLDHTPRESDRPYLGLNTASKKSTDALHSAAQSTINEIRSEKMRPIIRRFLRHKARGPKSIIK